MAIDPTLKRGDITSISLPGDLKERLDDVIGDNQTPSEFLSDILRGDVIKGLERFRRPDDSLGDIIVRLTQPDGRSPDEFDVFLEEARTSRKHIDGNSISIEL